MILLPEFTNVGTSFYTIILHFVGEALPFGGGEGRTQEMREELSQIVYMTLNTINGVSEIERSRMERLKK
jgi:hypothetical protein